MMWTRRRVLTAAGVSAGAGMLCNSLGGRLWAAEQIQTCTLTPELEVGPYYAPYELVRSDIREGKPGVPLRFTIEVRNAKTCAPVPGAAIDIWHCDALGIYSGFTKMPTDMFNGEHGGPGRPGGPPPPRVDGGFPGPPPGGEGGPPAPRQTDQETFLRGVQVTDAKGLVNFQSIYPGWYMGRDTHIHMKVHLGGRDLPGAGHASDPAHSTYAKYEGGHVCHIGQIAFDDALSDEIGKLDPYRQHRIERTRLSEDAVFLGEPRDYMMHVERVSSKPAGQGLRGNITVFVDPDATPKPVGMRPGGPPGGHAQ